MGSILKAVLAEILEIIDKSANYSVLMHLIFLFSTNAFDFETYFRRCQWSRSSVDKLFIHLWSKPRPYGPRFTPEVNKYSY